MVQQAADTTRTVAAKAGDRFADSWVTTKIQAKFFADRAIKARHIDVDTRDGVVTLSGYVENPELRMHAEQIARTTDGVRSVVDQLLVGHAPPGYAAAAPSAAVATTGSGDNPLPGENAPLDEASVVSSIQARYFRDPALKVRDIDVTAQSGVVTLHGAVANENERSQALTLARNTQGVQRVEDNLRVEPIPDGGAALAPGAAPAAAVAAGQGGTPPSALPQDDAAVVRSVQARLSDANAGAVSVSAKAGVVTVEGRVADTGARTRILDVVRQSAGVVQVIDRMTIGPR